MVVVQEFAVVSVPEQVLADLANCVPVVKVGVPVQVIVAPVLFVNVMTCPAEVVLTVWLPKARLDGEIKGIMVKSAEATLLFVNPTSVPMDFRVSVDGIETGVEYVD